MVASYILGYRVVALNPTDLYDLKKVGSIIEHLKHKYPNSSIMGVGV